MTHRTIALSAAAIAALAGCASQEDVRALRRPPLAPSSVALADPGEPLYRNVAVYEILGAPEFRLFDGAAVYTTRPTRGDVTRMLRSWLFDADMLTPDMAHARYLLTVRFEDLRGPDVVWFTDKSATATIHYTIEDARTRAPVFDQTLEAAFQARMPGVTEEMVRAAVAAGLLGGAIGAAVNDSHDNTNAQIAAGAMGLAAGPAAAIGAAAHDTLLFDWPIAVLSTQPRVTDGAERGLVVGALGAGAASTDEWSDVEAGALAGATGALSGFLGAAPAGRRAERFDDPSTIGAFDGTRRRGQAVAGMMRQNFNGFLLGLGEADMLNIRRAVPCSDLNPHGERPRDPADDRYGVGIITRTNDAVGYDCPARRRA